VSLLARFFRDRLYELVAPANDPRHRHYYDRDENLGMNIGGGHVDMVDPAASGGPQTVAPARTGTAAPATPGTAPTTVPPSSPMAAGQMQTSAGSQTADNSIAGSQTADNSIAGSRFTTAGDISHVNPLLLQTLHAGSTYLPPGYRVQMTSGYRDPHHNAEAGGAQNSQHLTGKAVDVQIIDDKGNVIPNKNQGPDSPYGVLARAGYHYLQQTNPEAAKTLNWGGNFNYHGFADSMHYDLGNRPGGQLSGQYQKYAQTDNFAPWKTDTTQVAAGSPSNKPPSNQVASLGNTAPGSSTPWMPANYPNAPTEWKLGISNPERNNPGNLRTAAGNDWVGKTTQPGSPFESFDTLQNGIRARAVTYGTYLNRGINTIDKISNTSGPASDGNNIASQNASYRQALGGRYAQPGGENLPIDFTPENVRRLTAGGISIENGGGGRNLPKGIPMSAIDSTIADLHQSGHFNTSPVQTAAATPPPTSTPTPPPAQTASATPPPTPPTPPTPTPPPAQTAAVTAPTPATSSLAAKPTQTASLDTQVPESYRRVAIHLLRPDK
jgi:hypothetical protein